MGNYIRFTEYNDNEGETWHFFIPEEGNAEEIEHLRDVVEERLDEEQYQVGAEVLTEEAVAVLVASNAWEDGGYDTRFNKLAGKLTVPGDIDDETLDGAFYKGGIRQMVKAPEPERADA